MIITEANYRNEAYEWVTNANIHVADGIIVDISFGEITRNKQTISAKGFHVLPGFIDCHNSIDIANQIYRFDGNDANETSGPIESNMRGIDALDIDDEDFLMSRKGGITTVITGPGKQNLIWGTFCAVKTGGCSLLNRIMDDSIAMHIVLSKEPRLYYGGQSKSPQTRMGGVALIREALIKAKIYHEKYQTEDKPVFESMSHELMHVFDGQLVKISATEKRYSVCSGYSERI